MNNSFEKVGSGQRNAVLMNFKAAQSFIRNLLSERWRAHNFSLENDKVSAAGFAEEDSRIYGSPNSEIRTTRGLDSKEGRREGNYRAISDSPMMRQQRSGTYQLVKKKTIEESSPEIGKGQGREKAPVDIGSSQRPLNRGVNRAYSTASPVKNGTANSQNASFQQQQRAPGQGQREGNSPTLTGQTAGNNSSAQSSSLPPINNNQSNVIRPFNGQRATNNVGGQTPMRNYSSYTPSTNSGNSTLPAINSIPTTSGNASLNEKTKPENLTPGEKERRRLNYQAPINNSTTYKVSVQQFFSLYNTLLFSTSSEEVIMQNSWKESFQSEKIGKKWKHLTLYSTSNGSRLAWDTALKDYQETRVSSKWWTTSNFTKKSPRKTDLSRASRLTAKYLSNSSIVYLFPLRLTKYISSTLLHWHSHSTWTMKRALILTCRISRNFS